MKIRQVHKLIIFCVLFGGIFLWASLGQEEVPLYSELSKAEGKVEWVNTRARAKFRGTHTFKFIGSDVLLHCPEIGGENDYIKKVLSNKNSSISVLYSKPGENISSNNENKQYNVYELMSDGKTVLSYDALVKSYTNSSNLIGLTGLLFWGLAFMLIYNEINKKNSN